jgi:hypothetical protein
MTNTQTDGGEHAFKARIDEIIVRGRRGSSRALVDSGRLRSSIPPERDEGSADHLYDVGRANVPADRRLSAQAAREKRQEFNRKHGRPRGCVDPRSEQRAHARW